MQYSILGSTGIRVSQIALGTATFGVAPTAEHTDRLVGAALDLGINFVDTADVYGHMPVFDRPGAAAAAAPCQSLCSRRTNPRLSYHMGVPRIVGQACESGDVSPGGGLIQ